MRIHRPEAFHESCGVTAISILTGWKFRTVRKRILEARRTYPIDQRGYPCKRNQMFASTENVYHNEAIRLLKQKGLNARFRKYPYEDNYVRYFSKYFPKGIYLLYIHDHLLVFKDGYIWDNQGIDQDPLYYKFRNYQVQLFTRVSEKRLTF